MSEQPRKREPEPSFGFDEEGEVPLVKRDVDEDPARWVHVDPAKPVPPTQ